MDLNPLKKRQRLLEAGFLNYCLIYHMLPDGYEELDRYQFANEFHGRLFALLKDMKAKNMPLTEEAVEGQLPREDISRLAKLRMEGEQPGSVPREEYIWPMKKIYLQEEYRIHTKKAQELISSDPAKAREEQLLCIQLSKEILALK